MKKVWSQSKALMYVFESNAEIIAFTEGSKFEEHAGKNNESFVGRKLENWEEVQQAVQGKWEEGMEILEESVNRLAKEALPEMKSRKRKTEFDSSEGDEFDYERFMSGQDPFRSSTRETHDGPGEITIVTDTTTPGSMEPEDIMWRGAVALALTKLLELKGYRVELWVINGSYLFANTMYPVCTACCLKRCQDTMDMSTLVNTVSGWFYRTATFTLLGTICEKEQQEVAWGLGRPYTPNPLDLNEVTPDQVRIYSSGTYSFSGAISQIRAEVERFKVQHGEGGDKAKK